MKNVFFCATLLLLAWVLAGSSCNVYHRKQRHAEEQKVFDAYIDHAQRAKTNQDLGEHIYWLREADKQFIKMYGRNIHQSK